jgi:hypothetical protein
MMNDESKRNSFNGNKNLIDSHCLDFCDQEITYATQRLAAELSIVKRLAADSSAASGGR